MTDHSVLLPGGGTIIHQDASSGSSESVGHFYNRALMPGEGAEVNQNGSHVEIQGSVATAGREEAEHTG